jgi:hypothetical protein
VAGLKRPLFHFPKITASHVFFGLVIFWGTWLYSEWEERVNRSLIEEQFHAFQAPGERFTKEDGKKMSERINTQRTIITALHSRISMDEGRMAIFETEAYQRIHAIERRLEGVEQHLIRGLDRKHSKE